MKTNVYLIEFYTCEPKTGEPGWDINFAWVHAGDEIAARTKLKNHQGRRLDTIIQCAKESQIHQLIGNFRCNTPDANLFILS